jgi:hypothetical protein
MKKYYLFLLCLLFSVGTGASSEPRTVQDPNSILLTVVLEHDQSLNVDEIQKIQDKQGFYKNFPPEGTSVVSWFVMMGLGQVVTLEVPASKLRDVNLAIEKTAWKAFKTKFYPTYNLYPVIKEKLKNKETIKL